MIGVGGGALHSGSTRAPLGQKQGAIHGQFHQLLQGLVGRLQYIHEDPLVSQKADQE